MTDCDTSRVSRFLTDLLSESPERHETVLQVRKLHFDSDPDLMEKIMYGGLVFFKGKELMSGIFLRKEHISIEFGRGSTLSDPDGVLEGKGKYRRHLKIRSLDDVMEKKVARYVQANLGCR